uniref:NADH-ubiquinone oxidoreductase chain 3 n=1 Tax=Torymus sp. ZJUH_2016035 TaxID=2491172 RepID=A0A3Q8UAE0_9HYME|nr:NADH dehydrogenase subunit 3 [Torymus sp. ZJUH_2016035]
MLLMFLVFILILMILLIMLFTNFLISKKLFKNREKMSPFECGFDPLSLNRLPFSLQFYLISIIFLIFDVEIAMILPIIEMDYFYSFLINYNSIFVFLILLFGLYVEWFEGALIWFK